MVRTLVWPLSFSVKVKVLVGVLVLFIYNQMVDATRRLLPLIPFQALGVN